MKWYFAINEQGTRTDVGQLARLAVISARRHTTLVPHLLYRGARCEFTEWMEAHGVKVIDVVPRYDAAIQRAINAGWYPRGMSGHWLRTEICHVEQEDPFVLYTDVDILFLKPIDLSGLRPSFFACAPEVEATRRDHFNSGVMVMNLPALRTDYGRLQSAIEHRFEHGEKTPFHDQTIFNEVYRDQWDLLDPIYNWKPYWKPNPDAAIFHFHGPKLDTIEELIDGIWKWETTSGYGMLAGEMIARHLPNYVPYFEIMRDLSSPGDALHTRLERILRAIPTALPAIRAAWQSHGGGDLGSSRPWSAHAVTQEGAPPGPGWRPDGPRAWASPDGRALVVRDDGLTPAVWRARVATTAVDRPSPAFLADPLGRVRLFVSAEAACRACAGALEAKKAARPS